ncbi:palmitoyltransferase-like protein akr1 [Phyllosticta citrichinensis]|uniref:Palmitoyltransferase n=1 Tax=Phyllosticta citrichinensis TaxID=1130410 RepID=A0ABR1XM09_9PEZI
MSSTPAAGDALTRTPSAGDQHELKDMAAQQPSLPVEEDVMQLARLGEIRAIQKLFDSGKYDATYRDEQGITPLHWAAINNHHALCHFLITSGADVNARGGDAVATPVLWAAKRCNYYIVALLLSRGADPLLTDDQGFNLLHSATLDGNVFQLVLLLHQDIPVDIPDAQGHTALMWAAYKGFPAVVEVLVRWGANVYARDDQGFTALHWALVKGSLGCIQKLIEYGSDRFAGNNEGRTPAITAQDMNSVRQWHKALSDSGYNPDGSAKYFPLQSIIKDRRSFFNKFFFVWPFLMIIVGLYILSHAVVYMAIPLALGALYILQWSAQQLLRWAPSDMKHIHKTPYLSGVFAGTLFWVGVRYITHVLPWTFTSNPFTNIFFVIFFTATTYFYLLTMFTDPGYIPKSSSRAQQKAIIDELITTRKFDEQNFCVHCMVRRPLRSKHCKRCNRCLAKQDHHCPWVDNCVANNNHRHFVLYILFMEVGIILFDRIILSYLSLLPPISNSESLQCTFLAPSLCETLHKDPFTILLTIWTTIQLVWVSMLVIVQLLQIARAQTTFEAMRSHNHFGAPTPDPLTSFVTTGSTSPDAAQLDPLSSAEPSASSAPSANAPNGAPRPGGPGQQPLGQQRRGGHHHVGCLAQWTRLLGLDTFMATALHGSNAPAVLAQRRENPYTRGCLTNCSDFWCDGVPLWRNRENGNAVLGRERINWTRVYDVPPRMTMRRRNGGAGGGGYEAVAGDEEEV